MKKILVLAFAVLLTALPLAAQQPNVPGVASLSFAGVDGPTYPMNVTWNSLVIGMEIQGAPGTAYGVVAGGPTLATGALAATGAPLGTLGLVDIDLSAPFITIMDGLAPTNFLDFLAVNGPSGVSDWTFPVGRDGRLGTFQGFVLDATAPAGITLTAASQVDVTASQNFLLAAAPTGDDVFFQIPLIFGSTIFYDQTYTDVFVNSNGSVTFGGGDADGVVSAAKFEAGFPRMAPLWTDLLSTVTVGGNPLIGTFVENRDGWVVNWTLRGHYVDPAVNPTPTAAAGAQSTFTLAYNYTTTVTQYNPNGIAGSIVFDYTIGDNGFVNPILGSLAADWGHMGITPGGTNPISPADPTLSTPLAPGQVPFDPTTDPMGAPSNGAGLLTNNTFDSLRADFTATAPNSLATLGGSGQQLSFEPLIFSATPGAEAASFYVLN